jgi:hypothetical protein
MTTSAINPNNINGEYPVAGQDNNTQGFRDNFTNIKINFQAAEAEINGLLANAISKSTSENNFDNSVISNARLQNVRFIENDQGNVANSAVINYATGSFQSIIPTANTVLSFSPIAGNSAAVITLVVNATAANTTAEPFHITIPNADYSSSGIIGYESSTGKLFFPRTNSTVAGTHTYQLITEDGGSSFTVSPVSTLTSPLNASSEDVANAAVVNLGVSDSYFSTDAAETATLPAGVNGQVKVLAMRATAGNMVITVTNPAWTGAGTITFAAAGDACTLKYINSKWFCIGNNGCTFA